MVTTEVDEDVDGGSLGMLPGAPTIATTEIDEDVDGRPPRGGRTSCIIANTPRVVCLAQGHHRRRVSK
jgi:hypothetical protein